MKKFIIFRTDRLGDFLIHSRPIYELKNKIKDSHITVVCSEINKKILSKVDYIDELIVFNKSFSIIKKLSIFFKIIIKKYHSTFVIDGKQFSFICNIFIRSKYKYGLVYKSKIKFFKFHLNSLKPSFFYNNLFFTKFEIFTSRKYLEKIEPLCIKYLNLFNNLDLNLTEKDNYIFQSPPESSREYLKISQKINLTDFLLIHFDEKWIDIFNLENDIVNSIIQLQKITAKKIVLTSYDNNFEYYNKIKNNFNYYDCKNFDLNKIKNSDILILDNLDIFLFERFIKNSKINISCHSGFIAQVCGANKGKIIDIINECDFNWYSCWKPNNTFHKFIFKSTFDAGQISLSKIFSKIKDVLLKL